MIPDTNTNGAAQTITAEQLMEVAPDVANALTRDYRSILNKSKSINNSKGPSNIDFSKL